MIRILSFIILLLSCKSANAQDTVVIKLADAEDLFIKNNLQLLAEKYNISQASAVIIQARLYNNPSFSFTGSIYNPELRKYFDISNKTGEYALSLQQVIILAGKRNKQIELAEANAALSEFSFYELLRTLRFTLRSDFYHCYFLQNSLSTYEIQITSLEKLNAAYEELAAKGVVTLKDAVRIKSLLYSLRADQTSIRNELNNTEAELQLLLQSNNIYFIPQVEKLPVLSTNSQLTLHALLDTAYANRYDLKLAETRVLSNRLSYNLQRAIRVPDLSLGATFDKRGSFVNNASFFSAAIDLPFFNRNQGNIKAAKINIDQSKTALELQRQIVENDVQKAYYKAVSTEKMLQSVDPDFQNQFAKLLSGITENFQKKNISLLEFTDFYESYRNNVLQFNQLQNDRMQAIEALNFAVGKTLTN